MATEIVTNWPMDNLAWRPGTLTGGFEDHVLRRLGAIEESLSRLERAISESRGSPTE